MSLIDKPYTLCLQTRVRRQRRLSSPRRQTGSGPHTSSRSRMAGWRAATAFLRSTCPTKPRPSSCSRRWSCRARQVRAASCCCHIFYFHVPGKAALELQPDLRRSTGGSFYDLAAFVYGFSRAGLACRHQPDRCRGAARCNDSAHSRRMRITWRQGGSANCCSMLLQSVNAAMHAQLGRASWCL